MKKLIILSGMVLGLGMFRAQTLTTSENYIYSKTYLSEDGSKKAESVQYFDGLGRLKQTVSIKSTPSGKDLVVPAYYDDRGRQVKDFLPLPMTTANSGIQTLSEADINTYYGVSNAYSEKIFDNSPLDRVLEVAAPGDAWKKGSGHTIQSEYETNISSDQVKKYNLTSSWTNATLSFSIPTVSWFGDNQLMKTVSTDEDGNQSIQFKNSQGQLLLARKMDGSVPVDTYYVYNLYDQLVLVIPPKANEKIAQNGNVATQEILDQLCYQYKYDHKNRLVEKRLPGKDFWEYLVYDRQNRLVLSQDANQHLKQWSFVKYDQLGRTVYTGLFANTSDRITMQNALNAAPVLNNETRTTASLAMNGENMYYTNTAFPTDNLTVLTINYYDEYAPEAPAKPTTIFGKATLGTSPVQFSSGGIVSYRSTKGMPTSSSVKNIENDAWTKIHIWYDTMGRTIGAHSINHLGGSTKTEIELDFMGVIQQTKTFHKRLAGDTEKTILQSFEYDGQNRLKKQWHTVDNLSPELLSENTYNDLSQLTNKKVGNNLQSIDYTYNIRGNVIKVNNPANLGGQLFGYELKYFNPQNTTSATGLYNGNITEVDWKTASDNVLRRYNYQYDAQNRLKKGIYSEPGTSVPENDFYNETVSYDLAGNIMSLQRNSKGGSGMNEQIDNLSYTYTGNRLQTVVDSSVNYGGYPDTSETTITYDNNGNMTNHIDKGVLGIQYNHLNLPDKVTFDQTYLVRNLVTGENDTRNITTQYLYRADGTKLKKTYTYGIGKNSSEAYNVTEYLDGFQYQIQAGIFIAPTLKFVPTSEGYYNFENNKYIYTYTDHLGNVRLSYSKNTNGSAEVLEENNYYPFGLKHQGYNPIEGNPAYKYQYNGKELQEETGWNDYGARMYMSDIGRWGVIDPLAESYRRWSPYHYAMDNPINFIDPDGMGSYNSDGQWVSEMADFNRYHHLSFNAPIKSLNQDGFGQANGGGTSATLLSQILNLGGTWQNTGYGFESEDHIALGYNGSYKSLNTLLDGYINIPEVILSGSSSGWGSQIQNYFNSFVKDWYTWGGRGNWFLGAGATLSGFAGIIQSENMYAQGIRRGLSGNYQLTGRNLSQFGKMAMTNTTKPISDLAKWGGVAGKVSFGIGVAMDGVGVYNYYYNPKSKNKVHPAKAGLNTTIGAYGLTGAGTIPAILYFGVDAFYPGGWEGYGNAYESIQSENSTIIPGFITAPYGSQKF